MSSLWHKIKGLGKKAVKTVKKTFTDPTSAFKEFTGSSILAGIGIPSVSGVGSSLVDMAKGVNWQREFYRTLEGYIPGTNINPIDRYLGKDIARMNFEQQQQAYDYQKWLNEQQMLREDEAYQRKLKDMTSAGFNPILAAGGSGSPSSPLRAGSAPQMADTSGALREGIGQALGIMTGFAGLNKIKAETAFIKSQREHQDIINAHENEYLTARNQNLILDNKLRSGTLQADIDYAISRTANSKKDLLIKNMTMMLGQADYDFKKLNIKFQELENSGKLTENQILDQKLKLVTTEVLKATLDYNNALWDTDYYHGMDVPVNFNTGWIGNLGQWLGRVGYRNYEDAQQLGGYFSLIKRALGLDGVGSFDSSEGRVTSPFVRNYKPFGRSFVHTWTTERWENYSSGDYGVRRNY